MPKRAKKRSPTDATIRNVRAANKRIRALELRADATELAIAYLRSELALLKPWKQEAGNG